MAANTKHSAIAATYARALLELAQAQQQAEPIGNELADLRKIVDASPQFADFLRDPAIGADERFDVLSKVFRGKVAPLLWNFLGVLNAKGRLGFLPQIDQAYQEQLAHLLGRIDVTVTVAQPLDEAMLSDVRQKLATALNKDPIITQKVDDNLIGGIVLEIEDQIIDGSVRAQLESMRKKLLAGARL